MNKNITHIGTPHHSAHYIQAIDGLRALAILMVLFFHVDFSWAKGGYIGVDIFFVISGFLITTNILRDIEAKRWSFYGFYTRRIARLFPALLTVISLTITAAYFIIPPDDLNRLSLSGFLAALSTSNIFFWMHSGYFDQASELKPLLHTWSLAVEEQFYFIWPLLLVFLLRFKNYGIALSLSLLFVLSISAALYFNLHYPNAVFFLTPFRIFQFALGGLIASKFIISPSPQRSVVGLLSILILILISIFLHEDVGGINGVLLGMLTPALATAVFIYSAKSPIITNIFNSFLMQWIGIRSYSIYLVHWPLIVLWNMATDFTLSTDESIILIAISIILGAILHTSIEKPFRISSKVTKKEAYSSGYFTLALFIICSSLTIGILYNNKLDNSKLQSSNVISKGDTVESSSSNNEKTCFLEARNSPSDYALIECATPPADKPSFLIIGDSLAGDIYISLLIAYPNAFFGHFVVPGCPLETPQSAKNQSNHCQVHYNHAYTYVLNKIAFDGVILVSKWSEESIKSLDEIIGYFKKKDMNLTLIGARPEYKAWVQEMSGGVDFTYESNIKVNNLLISSTKEINQRLQKHFLNQLFYIDIYNLLCTDLCSITDKKGDPLYRDKIHFTMRGSSWLGQKIKEQYPNFVEQALR